MNGYETTLGYTSAIDELDDDDSLKLYEAEIGLFDLQNDAHNAVESFIVVVAAVEPMGANENAQMLCEDTIPVVRDMAFSPMSMATEINL